MGAQSHGSWYWERPGTGKTLQHAQGRTWGSVWRRDMRGEYQQSCGRDRGGSHLPLPSADLLPFWREQVMKGSQVLHPHQDPRAPLDQENKGSIREKPWTLPSGPSPTAGHFKKLFEAYLGLKLFRKHFSTCVPRITLSWVRYLSFQSGR